jgi:RES domain-containing protein
VLEHLAKTLAKKEAGRWTGLAYRHISPSFDPLSTRGAELHGGRWNKPGTPALYLALSIETARAEFDRLVELRAQAASDLHPRNLVTVQLDLAEVVDLQDDSVIPELGADDGSYVNLSTTLCQEAGEMVAGSGASGLLAPSVTNTGTILVAFPQNFTPEDETNLVDQTDIDWT